MSRVFFARQIQYYKAKISRENRQLSVLQEALSSEQANASNKQRQWNQMNHLFDWAIGKRLMEAGVNPLGSGSYGNNNILSQLLGNNSSCSDLLSLFTNGNISQYMNGLTGSDSSGLLSSLLGGSGFDDLKQSMYQAFASRNDYQDLYDDNAISEMMCDDLEQQITAVNSQIKADTQELKAYEEGEKEAISRSASKYA